MTPARTGAQHELATPENTPKGIDAKGPRPTGAAAGHGEVHLAAEQGVGAEAQHQQPAGHVNRGVLGDEHVTQCLGPHCDQQDHRRDPGGEQESHRDQQAPVLEGAGEVSREHDRDAARREQGDRAATTAATTEPPKKMLLSMGSDDPSCRAVAYSSIGRPYYGL
jgi:hypothetical protein